MLFFKVFQTFMLSIHTRSVKENCTSYIREYAIVVHDPMQK